MTKSSKKITTAPAASTTPAKKPASSKVTAAAAKETPPIPSKKVSAPITEAPAGKPAATAKSAPAKSIRKNTVTPEERYKMIATAAFFRAEQRGFATGNEMADWSISEAEIDAMLNA